MVTDKQVRRLRKLSNMEKNQEIAASKAGMDPTTARRYLGLGRLPSELKKERQWRTRENPFGEVWEAVERQIQESPRRGRPVAQGNRSLSVRLRCGTIRRHKSLR